MTSHTNLAVFDAGLTPYRPAWDRQLEIHTRVLNGELPHGALMLVEHPPVITYGRRPDSQRHLLASAVMLQARGVELVETDRGGDITFHGPGQLVVYPIIPLNTYNLNLHSYMRLLEDVVIKTIAAWGLIGQRLDGATGVWITGDGKTPPTAPPKKCCDASTLDHAKICAMGVKVRKWVTFHGLALNVTTDLSFFDLINPCGLGRPVTSMQKLLGPACPSMDQVKQALTAAFADQLAAFCSSAFRLPAQVPQAPAT